MGGGQEPTPDPKAVEAELQKRVEDIAYRMYENSGKSQYIRSEWADKPYHPDDATRDILALIKSSNLALLERVEEELQLFTAEHDQPMRDEALGVINSLRKEYE